MFYSIVAFLPTPEGVRVIEWRSVHGRQNGLCLGEHIAGSAGRICPVANPYAETPKPRVVYTYLQNRQARLLVFASSPLYCLLAKIINFSLTGALASGSCPSPSLTSPVRPKAPAFAAGRTGPSGPAAAAPAGSSRPGPAPARCRARSAGPRSPPVQSRPSRTG